MRGPFLSFGPFQFDPGRRLLKRDGVELALPPRVLGVLEALLRRPGDVVSRQELMDSVWKDAFVTDTSLAEAVSVLRQTLGDDPQAPSYIQTLHRRGYRFVADVAEQGPRATITAVAPESGEPHVSISGFLVPWSVAVVCAALAVVAVWQALARREGSELPVTRFEIAPVPGTRFDSRAPALALAPDASRVVWSACDSSTCRLYVRSTDRVEPQLLSGTEGAAAPFFSTDGRSVGFFADGRLKKVAIAGGAPVTLADAADALGGVWTADREIVYAGAGPGLMRVAEAGGQPSTLTTPDAGAGEVRHVWPSLHPAFGVLLFTILTTPEGTGSGRLAALRLSDGPARWTTLLPGAGRAVALASDLLLLALGSQLHVGAFDAQRGTVQTASHAVVPNLAMAQGAGQFAGSPAGAVVTIRASGEPEGGSSLFWWSPGENGSAGSAREDLPLRDFESVALSPDGRSVAGLVPADALRYDVWIADLVRGTSSRLTHADMHASPVWSADGRRVYFASSSGGAFAVFGRDVDAPSVSSPLHRSAAHAWPVSASGDRSALAFVTRDPSTGLDVWSLRLNGGSAEPLVRTPFDDAAAAFSRDGRLVAYQSNDAGRWEVYVHRRSDGRRIPISTSGGTHPFWSADGRWLFFRAAGGLMRTAIEQDGRAAGHPELVARLDDAVPIGQHPDGRILFRNIARQADRGVLALHWLPEARLLLGPRESPLLR